MYVQESEEFERLTGLFAMFGLAGTMARSA